MTSHGASQGPLALQLSLSAAELAAAWRPGTRHLVLPFRQAPRLQQEVAVRLGLAGRAGAAVTVTGRVVAVHPHGEGHAVEVAPDDGRMAALERLLAVARGEVEAFEGRAPRFLARLPVVVTGAGGLTYMTTVSVSERGCGLAWSGPPPQVGAALDLRLGAGVRAASFRAVVCWCGAAGRRAAVGVRFVAGRTPPWLALLAEVEQAGAPIA